MIRDAGFDGPSINFFTDCFVAQLATHEREHVEWRPVQQGRKGVTFFEPVARSAHVPFVSLSEVAATLWSMRHLRGSQHTRWVCDTCGRRQQPVYWYRMSSLPLCYISAATIGDPYPSFFTVGDPETPRMCFTRDRWSELVNRPEAIGLASSDVGVVAPSLVDPTPPTRRLSDFKKGGSPVVSANRAGTRGVTD